MLQHALAAPMPYRPYAGRHPSAPLRVATRRPCTPTQPAAPCRAPPGAYSVAPAE